MSQRIFKIINQYQGLGVVGGTAIKKKKGFIRESDRQLVCPKGVCHIHRHPQLPSIDIVEYTIPYQMPPEAIRQILPRVSLVSGLCIANPVARYLMYNFPLEEINKISLEEALKSPRLPLIIDTEPEDISGYVKKMEDFRVDSQRPHWIFKMANYDFSHLGYPWFAKTKDGHYRKIGCKKARNFLPRYYIPVANGVEWMVDYGILTVLPNPLKKQKKMVIIGGNHWLATFALGAMVALAPRIPEENAKIEGIKQSMAWLYKIIQREQIENFQALIRVTDTFYPERDHRIDLDILGVFSLDS